MRCNKGELVISGVSSCAMGGSAPVFIGVLSNTLKSRLPRPFLGLKEGHQCCFAIKKFAITNSLSSLRPK